MWFTSSSGWIELEITKIQAASCSHPGSCDAEVLALSSVPKIARQLKKINAEKLRCELKGYGAWSDEELADHEQNLQRILWIAAGDIDEGRSS